MLRRTFMCFGTIEKSIGYGSCSRRTLLVAVMSGGTNAIALLGNRYIRQALYMRALAPSSISSLVLRYAGLYKKQNLGGSSFLLPSQ